MRRQLLLLMPALLVTGFVGIFPIFALLNYALQTPFAIENKFVGLSHFYTIFRDYRFVEAVGRTLILVGVCLAIEIPLGLGLAYLLRKPGRISGVISALIILPTLFPAVTIGMMWLLMVRSNGPIGLILNNILKVFGITYDPFKDAFHAFGTVVLMDVWHWTGLVFLVSLAAVSAIEETYVLSARVEGATRWQIFKYIELPQLTFPITFICLLRLIDTLKIFDEVYILTGGGPSLTTEYITQYIRTVGIEQWNIGYASAMSLTFLFIVIMLCWLMIIMLTRGRGLIE